MYSAVNGSHSAWVPAYVQSVSEWRDKKTICNVPMTLLPYELKDQYRGLLRWPPGTPDLLPTEHSQ